eukprot:TRINITY_DN3358_c2_g1_i1.p1 TRINITY_DN3358_c2_g1~~TRINITY_DN3358_c2_g1_i1.p1  ORF type:complete len:929 (+),score=162.58 TRINITY_DN3358_c2_g1_i1:43-2829(+)
MASNRALLDPDENTEDEYISIFGRYFEHHLDQFESVMLEEDTRKYYSLIIDGLILLNLNVKVGHLLLARPEEMLPLAEKAAILIQITMLEKVRSCEDASLLGTNSPTDYTVKRNINIRVSEVPLTTEFCKPSITALRTEDVGQLIRIKGTVVREGSVKMYEATKEYVCDRCHGIPEGRQSINTISPVHGPGVVQRPPSCFSCGRTMIATPSVELSGRMRDYQELKLQDQVAHLTAGTIPRAITVALGDDLVETCRAGDDILCIGILTQRWLKEPKPEQRCSIELILHANHVKVTNENKSMTAISNDDEDMFEEFWQTHSNRRLEARNLILSWVCPQVYGMHKVKLGLILVLIGGFSVNNEEAHGNKTRGECHMLLVGDPGTAKSQFLRFASKMSCRSVCTTGIGSTSAGLTVSASKECGEWVLDAGALVIADGGVCCIDEFSTIPEQKHIAIHEAMEQQTISIAKAGLVTTLNTRCSIIAACNPKKDQSVMDGETAIGIATPLLSRFDLVMVLLDGQDDVWDDSLARFLLKKAEEPPWEPDHVTAEVETSRWDTEMLRNYISWVRSKKSGPLPPMTPAASTLLQRYFNSQRENRSVANRSRRTVRMLESLIRLAQAHSLLLNKTEVTLEDAVVAVSLTDLTNNEPGGTDVDYGPLHSEADPDPENSLLRIQRSLVRHLNLQSHPHFSDISYPEEDDPKPCGLQIDGRYAFQSTQQSTQNEDPMAVLFASRITGGSKKGPSTKCVKKMFDSPTHAAIVPLTPPVLPSLSGQVLASGSSGFAAAIPSETGTQTQKPSQAVSSQQVVDTAMGLDFDIDVDMNTTNVIVDKNEHSQPLLQQSTRSTYPRVDPPPADWSLVDVDSVHPSNSHGDQESQHFSQPPPAKVNKPTFCRSGLVNPNRAAMMKSRKRKVQDTNNNNNTNTNNDDNNSP